MDTGSTVGWLFGMTIAIALLLGLFMLYRVRRSQAKRGEVPGEIPIGERGGAANQARSVNRPEQAGKSASARPSH